MHDPYMKSCLKTAKMADLLNHLCLSAPTSELSRIVRFFWIAGVGVHTAYVVISSAIESFSAVSKNTTESLETKSKVIFFPDKQFACRRLLFEEKCNVSNCQYAHQETSLSTLIKLLLKAQHSLDVCVFTINCRELADAVIKLYRDGIVVRILTDDEQMGSSGSQIERFRREGIQVRHDVSSFFMHHKFAVIDRQCLVNGSFNWTKQAVTGNRENVVITRERNLVKCFFEEFDKLWEEYDPARRYCGPTYIFNV